MIDKERLWDFIACVGAAVPQWFKRSAAFRLAVTRAETRPRRRDHERHRAQWRVGHTTQAGVQPEMAHNGEHCVNGEPIDYGAWKLYGAPEAQADLNSDGVHFAYGGESLTLDLSVDPDDEMIRRRVIG